MSLECENNDGFRESKEDLDPSGIHVGASPGLKGAFHPVDENNKNHHLSFGNKKPMPWTKVVEFGENFKIGAKEKLSRDLTKRVIELVVYVVIGVYVIVASVLHFDDAKPTLIIYCIAVFFYAQKISKLGIRKLLNSSRIQDKLEHLLKSKSWKYFRITISAVFYIIIACLIIFVTIYWNYEDPVRLKSAGGLLVLVLFSVLISKHKTHIKWRTVFWGLALQFGFGVFVLRTDVGFDLFDWLGETASDFLDFGLVGVNFNFQPQGKPPVSIFAVTTLMIIPFFSAFVSFLYHIGLMQFIIRKIAWVMQKTLATTAVESISAAGNIFVGQTEAPLLVKPYIQTMTLSELHAVMTGGFATIAGGVFAAYVSMGVSPSHLISASVMSAPAALSFSKIVYPETEHVFLSERKANETEQKEDEDSRNDVAEEIKRDRVSDSGYVNFVHAIADGAGDGMKMVLNIIANLIAILSLLEATNYMLTYLGELINIKDLTLYVMFQYIFYPLAFILGAHSDDCLNVGELLGLKTIANEFIAYDQMGRINAGSQPLSARSNIIATYALCGFSNLGSIGIQIGGLGALAPNRKGDMAKIGISAFITGSIACFSTACIAGLLYES